MSHNSFASNLSYALYRFILCVILSLSLFGLSKLKAQKPGFFNANGREINIDDLNSKILKVMKDIYVPGMTFAVIDNNQVVFTNFYGYKDQMGLGGEVNDATVFEACSLSKQFLVFIALKLVDEGKLDLDKPMCQYLKYEPLEYDSRYKLITARMVLSHTSGIENGVGQSNVDKLKILSDPGKEFVYSGAGYNYLADVIESIIGETKKTYYKRILFRPLKLKRSFSEFGLMGLHPSNYAVGHTINNKPIKKWKNLKPVASSGVSTVAEDYAKLVISTFNREYLSENRVKDILQPICLLGREADKSFYWGAGYGIQHSKTDTIVFQNGSNDGFKGWMQYSTVSKNGLVFFTNGDYGMSIAKKLNEFTVNFNMGLDSIGMQYPNDYFTLLKTFREKSAAKIITEIDTLNSKSAIPFNTLNKLAWAIFEENKLVARSVMEKNIRLYPKKPEAYYNLGKLNMALEEYKTACENLIRSKELNFYAENLDNDIEICRSKIGKE